MPYSSAQCESYLFRRYNCACSGACKKSSEPKLELNTEDIDLLRSNEVFQIAEFYYLAQKYGLADRGKIRPYLLQHNEDMRELIANKAKRDALGLPKSRLENEALFSDTQIQKVVQLVADGKLYLDQSDLGRLLCTLISAETTRKAVVVLGKAGFFDRIKIGSVLIVSNGKLETYFEKHLHSIVIALQQGVSGGEHEICGHTATHPHRRGKPPRRSAG